MKKENIYNKRLKVVGSSIERDNFKDSEIDDYFCNSNCVAIYYPDGTVYLIGFGCSSIFDKQPIETVLYSDMVHARVVIVEKSFDNKRIWLEWA